jgi:hypothetical protein
VSAGDRGRRRRALAPHRQAGAEHAGDVAHHAVGDQPGDARFAMRAQRMSPKMPASVTPIASATAMQPSGIASIAARVEIGEDQDRRRREILARRHEAQREGAARPAALARRSGRACRASRRCAGPSSAGS